MVLGMRWSAHTMGATDLAQLERVALAIKFPIKEGLLLWRALSLDRPRLPTVHARAHQNARYHLIPLDIRPT
jgi:hypothetical protein